MRVTSSRPPRIPVVPERPVITAFGALLLMAALVAGMGGCTGITAPPCGGGCPSGKVCDYDTGLCIDPQPSNCPKDLGRYLSLAVAANGWTVFSSGTGNIGALVVGRIQPDGTMDCEIVDGTAEITAGNQGAHPVPFLLADDVGWYSSLALDPLDRPQVAYFDRTNGKLKYAWKSGVGWEVITVPWTGSADQVVGRGCSLGLNSEGLPHIAFLDETSGSLKVARKFGDGRWAVEIVPVGSDLGGWPGTLGGEVGRFISMVLDAHDREWIAFRDVHTGSLKVAGRQPEGWNILEVDPGKDVGTWVSAALDADGNMALAYHDRTKGTLNYACNLGGTLKRVVVDSGWETDQTGVMRHYPTGQHCALAFGRDGLPRILYLDGGDLDLKLVAGNLDGGFSQPETLDRQGAVGFFNDLALGPNGLSAASCRYGRDDQGRLDGDLALYQLDAEIKPLSGFLGEACLSLYPKGAAAKCAVPIQPGAIGIHPQHSRAASPRSALGGDR